MKADLLTRLRQWSEKPNEGDPIIDAMAGDLQEALEFIEAVERSRPLFYGVFDASGGLVGLFDDEGRANESLMGERIVRPFYATPVVADGTALEAAIVLRRRVDELEAEIERMTPKFVAYEYLVSPAGEEMAIEENARLRARIADLEAKL